MAKSILLVKTSSLGDVIHALPAVSDARSMAADVRIDWAVEEPFAAVPRLHAGVSGVIAVAVRRWRRALWRVGTYGEIAACASALRERDYDVIVDAQGLFKSALIALVARGKRYGLDFHSSREPLAWCYDRTFRVSWELHAVQRNRLLLARALEYEVPPGCAYGIRAVPRRFDWLAPGAYAVLLHATSGDYKLWDEDNWVALGEALNSSGVSCVLPWGSERERGRSRRLADKLRAATVPPLLSLDEIAGLFAGARAVVGVDTGLAHLAAALGVPTVGVYCGTDPAATGIYGCARSRNLGDIGHAPTAAQVITALEKLAS